MRRRARRLDSHPSCAARVRGARNQLPAVQIGNCSPTLANRCPGTRATAAREE